MARHVQHLPAEPLDNLRPVLQLPVLEHELDDIVLGRKKDQRQPVNETMRGRKKIFHAQRRGCKGKNTYAELILAEVQRVLLQLRQKDARLMLG